MSSDCFLSQDKDPGVFLFIKMFIFKERDCRTIFYHPEKRGLFCAIYRRELPPRIKTVREMAREANMSLRSFKNKFNLVFGTSPGRWILQRKMQTVYREIVTSHIPLTVIADKCGFASLSHMSDFCKKHLGKSPSQIRKEGYL